MASGSYWCYSCNRFVWVSNSISCPDCSGGFLEHINQSPNFTTTTTSSDSDSLLRRSPTRFPPPSTAETTPSPSPSPIPTAPAATRTISSRSSPNPVIVLRGPSSVTPETLNRSSFQMYYDDGTDSGLRPLPQSMTEFLLGSGFDRLLDQISQIELNTNRNNNHRSGGEHPPADKSAVEALPVIEIELSHLQSDSQSHCAVCKENFVLKSSAREMPCNHIYHPDCILPWLAIRNSCPVCRHELPAEDIIVSEVEVEEEGGDSAAGLTIWRLPGGGFAVGRIPGGWRGGGGGVDRMMPVVYTEVDGGGGGDARLTRRVAWGSRRRGGRRDVSGGNRERVGGLAGRIMRLFGCFNGSLTGSVLRVNRRSRLSSARRRNWLA